MAAIQHTDNTKFIDRLRNQQPSNVIYQVLVGILELGTDKRKCWTSVHELWMAHLYLHGTRYGNIWIKYKELCYREIVVSCWW
jgi:hypothetical protein